MVLEITNSNFQKEVNESEIPVLLDFWADWCGPCKMASPIVEQVSEELNGLVKFGKINVQNEEQLSQNFKIMSIPTFILIKNGEVVKTNVGLQSKEQLINMCK